MDNYCSGRAVDGHRHYRSIRLLSNPKSATCSMPRTLGSNRKCSGKYNVPISSMQKKPYAKTRKPTSLLRLQRSCKQVTSCPELFQLKLELDEFQIRWLAASQKTKLPRTNWDGLFIKRYNWTPSFVHDWLTKRVIKSDNSKCLKSDTDNSPVIHTINLFPPIYQKWIKNSFIQKALTNTLQQWIMYTCEQKPNWNILDYQTILQLCFDLNLSSEFDCLWTFIHSNIVLDWHSSAILHNIF